MKKAWELFLCAYPYFQAFALPRFKDKQRKPAHAEWLYLLDIIHPRRRFAALPLWNDSKLRSLKVQTVTFWKRPFPFGKPPFRSPEGEGRSSLPQDSIKIVRPALPQKTGLVAAKVRNNSYIMQVFSKKICKKQKKSLRFPLYKTILLLPDVTISKFLCTFAPWSQSANCFVSPKRRGNKCSMFNG